MMSLVTVDGSRVIRKIGPRSNPTCSPPSEKRGVSAGRYFCRSKFV